MAYVRETYAHTHSQRVHTPPNEQRDEEEREATKRRSAQTERARASVTVRHAPPPLPPFALLATVVRPLQSAQDVFVKCPPEVSATPAGELSTPVEIVTE